MTAQLLEKILREKGYSVTSVNSSAEALKVFKAFPNDFDLVISDYNMPKINGKILAQKIKSLRDNIPIIVCAEMTQLSEKIVSDELGIEVIQKPVVMVDLNRTLKKFSHNRLKSFAIFPRLFSR